MMENWEGKPNPFKGRDHHVSAFTIWMAGGGIPMVKWMKFFNCIFIHETKQEKIY